MLINQNRKNPCDKVAGVFSLNRNEREEKNPNGLPRQHLSLSHG